MLLIPRRESRYAIREPWGDQLGSNSGPRRDVSRRSPDPSALALQMSSRRENTIRPRSSARRIGLVEAWVRPVRGAVGSPLEPQPTTVAASTDTKPSNQACLRAASEAFLAPRPPASPTLSTAGCE